MPTISEVSQPAIRTCAASDLVGRWEFRRRLVDRGAGLLGRAHGRLTVAPDGDGFRWHEDGELVWNGRRAPITRTLAFALINDQWWVTFSDGRPFHLWRIGASVSHPCGNDRYTGQIRLTEAGDRLRIGWDVSGPSKHQRIMTAYRRVS